MTESLEPDKLDLDCWEFIQNDLRDWLRRQPGCRPASFAHVDRQRFVLLPPGSLRDDVVTRHGDTHSMTREALRGFAEYVREARRS